MRRIATNKSKKGFTLTELAVAIVFISILLLTIAVVTLNMVKTYHKGNTMKAINTIGLELISEFSNAISASSSFDYKTYCETLTDPDSKESCLNDKGQKFIFQEKRKKVTISNTSTSINQAQQYGVFCTGKYTYVWNTGYTMRLEGNFYTKSSDLYKDEDGNQLNSLNGGNASYRLRKYQDPLRSICSSAFDDTTSYNDDEDARFSNIQIKIDTLVDDGEELITTQDIAIFSLEVDSPIIEEVSLNSLYTVHLILGSISGGIIADQNSDPSCNIETNSAYDVEYCATNKFNFTMQANGMNNI